MIAFRGAEDIRSSLGRAGTAVLARAAAFAMNVPILGDALLDGLLHRLASCYEQADGGSELLAHQRWFGRQLRPFLDRLVRDRPAAARAMLRFLGAWVCDVRRRTQGVRDGQIMPCTVVIEATDRCNLNCPGCYANSGPDGHDLSYEHLQEIVEQVADMGVTLVTISGGEPFLRERSEHLLSRLARQFPDRGFLVYTNGTLIDAEVADRLAGVGNIFPAISVEGFEHQTNARRGRGVYQANRKARRLLAERGVMCGFSATVTRENAEAICQDAFIDQRIAEEDMFGWFFLLQPVGRSPRVDLMPTADQRAMLRETIHRWRAEQRPIFLGDFWNDGPLVGGCIAGGRYYFHIRANSDIRPCVFSPVVCGNVIDILEGRGPYASLADFVRDNPVFRAYRRKQAEITDRNRPCLLIDHPQAFREIARQPTCRPDRTMPPSYLDGEIASAIDAAAEAWAERSAKLPPFAAELSPVVEEEVDEKEPTSFAGS